VFNNNIYGAFDMKCKNTFNFKKLIIKRLKLLIASILLFFQNYQLSQCVRQIMNFE